MVSYHLHTTGLCLPFPIFGVYFSEEYKRKQNMKSEDTKAMASLKWSTAELKQVSPNSPCLLIFKYVVYIQQQKFSFAQVTLTLSSS